MCESVTQSNDKEKRAEDGKFVAEHIFREHFLESFVEL